MPTETERLCPACGNSLVRREGESKSNFKKRVTCGGDCKSATRWIISTETHPYQSKHGGFVTAAVFLAELMCERQAAKKNTELKTAFWQQPEWAREFVKQIRLASGLFKNYSPAAVSRALRSSKGRHIYSLGVRWLDELIAREQAQLNKEQESLAKVVVTITLPVGPLAANRPAFTPQASLKNKLKGL